MEEKCWGGCIKEFCERCGHCDVLIALANMKFVVLNKADLF